MSNATNITGSIRIVGMLGVAVVIAGCASSTPATDATFGDAVRAARIAQTLNPDASANRNPVTGIDGQSGVRAIQGYENPRAARSTLPPLPSMNVEGD